MCYKGIFLVSLLTGIMTSGVFSQETDPVSELQLERHAESGNETEDDNIIQELARFRKHPLNLNLADENELQIFSWLSPLQIAHLLSYRKLLGSLMHIYELQAVPGWDLISIRRILPYVTVENSLNLREGLQERFTAGQHAVLFRVSQVLERAKAYLQGTTGAKYPGSPQRLFVRYSYNYKNNLKLGLLAEKDAGEQMFKGAQKQGFDFYSFHLYVKDIAKVQALAVGDYTINLGEGLIQWQSMAFKKGADAINIKRQSQVIRPYSSAGEFNFYRGLAFTLKKKKISASFFGSLRNLTANTAQDTSFGGDIITSFSASGLHRTAAEIADRKSARQQTAGASLQFKHGGLHLAVNGIGHFYSVPIKKNDAAYNRFAVSGKKWFNSSIDYSYTYRNAHFFGEFAMDRNLQQAMLHGLMCSIDPRVDIAVLFRRSGKGYQALYANAFTESSLPSNENGLYAGISIKPNGLLRMEMYADMYSFPFFKYQLDGPSEGRDLNLQVMLTPNKKVEVIGRFRQEVKNLHENSYGGVFNGLTQAARKHIRVQLNYKHDGVWFLRHRLDILRYTVGRGRNESGFLTYLEGAYKPPFKQCTFNCRLQYFETDSYEARLYAHESDVLYGFSIPAFFGRGYRYYASCRYSLNRDITVWLRLAQTIYEDRGSIGSGADEIPGNKKTELSVQARYEF